MNRTLVCVGPENQDEIRRKKVSEIEHAEQRGLRAMHRHHVERKRAWHKQRSAADQLNAVCFMLFGFLPLVVAIFHGPAMTPVMFGFLCAFVGMTMAFAAAAAYQAFRHGRAARRTEWIPPSLPMP